VGRDRAVTETPSTLVYSTVAGNTVRSLRAIPQRFLIRLPHKEELYQVSLTFTFTLAVFEESLDNYLGLPDSGSTMIVYTVVQGNVLDAAIATAIPSVRPSVCPSH